LDILNIPENEGLLSPVLHVILLQLLAYRAALVKSPMSTRREISRRA